MNGTQGVLNRLRRQSVAYALASIVGPGTGILLLPVYTRFLSPDEYGLIALLEVISLVVAAVFSIGMPAIIPFLYVERRDPAQRRRAMGTLIAGVTVVNVVLAVAAFVAGPWLLRAALPSVPFHPYVPVLLLTALLEPYWVMLGSVLQIQERADVYSALSLARIATAIGWRLWYVVGLEAGVLGFVTANLWTAVVWMVVSVVLLRREAAPAFEPKEIRAALAVGGPTVPNNLLTYGFRLMDRVVLDRFVAREQIGLYYMAVRLGDVLRLGAEVFIAAWRPVFFKEAANPAFARDVAPRVMRLVVAGFVAAFVALSLFAREAIALLTAPSYAGAWTFVPFVAAAMALKGIYAFPSLAIWHRKQTHLMPLMTLATLAVSLVANVALGARFGALGVAAALTVSYASLFAIVSVVSRRLYDLAFPWRAFAASAALGTAAVAAGALASAGLSGLTLRALIMAVYTIALVPAAGISTDELRGLWRGRRAAVRDAVAEPTLAAKS